MSEDFKIQCVRCSTCNHIFAVIVEKYISVEWLRSCAKYIKTGNATLETMNHSELGDQFGFGLAKCCGRKVKSKDK